ncbi:beta-defensin 126-like [Mirounga leonina]|uniref:beta-defensin 126-like n=1 Tax=Mirounga leonina TaxID=9715 RepID=UPI00156C56CD|nr:beta-defensin 126-like [Mirounga leonina]XP_045739802.1 beta-defensin 126-like [Mirounga angustirostris]
MKSLLFILAIFFLLAHLVSGHLFLRRCENKTGYCKKKCSSRELRKDHLKWRCNRHKLCCVLAIDNKIKPLSSRNKIFMPTVKNQQLSTTKKLITTLMVITTFTI